MVPETLVLSDYGTVIGKDNPFCPCEISKRVCQQTETVPQPVYVVI